MARLRYNNSLGTLGAGMLIGDTSITFASAPSWATLAAGDYIPLVLEPPTGSGPSANFEVAHVTAYTAGATSATISRGQEGTSALAHANGSAWMVAPLALDLPTAIDPATYGAKGDCLEVSDGAMASGSPNLACATSTPFTSTAVDGGKTITVMGAGAAGAALKTTISSVTDSGHAVLAANAGTTVASGARTQFGTPDDVAINSAMAAAAAIHRAATASNTAVVGNVVQLRAANYLITAAVSMRTGVVLRGMGLAATVLQQRLATPFGLLNCNSAFENTFSVRDLRVDGAGATQTGSNPAVDFFRSSDLTILPYTPAFFLKAGDDWFGTEKSTFPPGGDHPSMERVAITNVAGHGFQNDFVDFATRDCFIFNVTGDGITTTGSQTSDGEYIGCHIGYCGTACVRFASTNERMVGCKLYQSGEVTGTTAAIEFTSSARAVHVSATEIQQVLGPGVHFNAAKFCSFRGSVDGSKSKSVWFDVGAIGCYADVISTKASFGTYIPTYDVFFQAGANKNTAQVTSDGNASVASVGYNADVDRQNGTVLTASGAQATGTATLVGGTIAVANTAITASAKIRVFNLAAGGTVGALSVAIAAGTGFTINSSSGTDTSTIYYEIVSY